MYEPQIRGKLQQIEVDCSGDHSWGKNLDACEPDLQYIADLPGRKILLRGNHDMFWDAKKIVERELDRLRVSFETAKADGYRKFILFLHYPPTSIPENESGFTRMAEEYRAEQVIYAHSHGESRFYDSVLGEKNGVEYRLVSGDFLQWKPVRRDGAGGRKRASCVGRPDFHMV